MYKILEEKVIFHNIKDDKERNQKRCNVLISYESFVDESLLNRFIEEKNKIKESPINLNENIYFILLTQCIEKYLCESKYLKCPCKCEKSIKEMFKQQKEKEKLYFFCELCKEFTLIDK